MKIRIGDITLEQFDKLCNDQPTCDDCPLHGKTMCLSDEWDMEVDIPNKYLQKSLEQELNPGRRS